MTISKKINSKHYQNLVKITSDQLRREVRHVYPTPPLNFQPLLYSPVLIILLGLLLPPLKERTRGVSNNLLNDPFLPGLEFEKRSEPCTLKYKAMHRTQSAMFCDWGIIEGETSVRKLKLHTKFVSRLANSTVLTIRNCSKNLKLMASEAGLTGNYHIDHFCSKLSSGIYVLRSVAKYYDIQFDAVRSQCKPPVLQSIQIAEASDSYNRIVKKILICMSKCAMTRGRDIFQMRQEAEISTELHRTGVYAHFPSQAGLRFINKRFLAPQAIYSADTFMSFNWVTVQLEDWQLALEKGKNVTVMKAECNNVIGSYFTLLHATSFVVYKVTCRATNRNVTVLFCYRSYFTYENNKACTNGRIILTSRKGVKLNDQSSKTPSLDPDSTLSRVSRTEEALPDEEMLDTWKHQAREGSTDIMAATLSNSPQ
ncbi:hypothetical protein J6590_068385 [Homalodisca vitripennis]|nr:hypothetical protein J6590_068385 [Homalodisca vitripennis]